MLILLGDGRSIDDLWYGDWQSSPAYYAGISFQTFQANYEKLYPLNFEINWDPILDTCWCPKVGFVTSEFKELYDAIYGSDKPGYANARALAREVMSGGRNFDDNDIKNKELFKLADAAHDAGWRLVSFDYSKEVFNYRSEDCKKAYEQLIAVRSVKYASKYMRVTDLAFRNLESDISSMAHRARSSILAA